MSSETTSEMSSEIDEIKKNLCGTNVFFKKRVLTLFPYLL